MLMNEMHQFFITQDTAVHLIRGKHALEELTIPLHWEA